MTQSFYQVGGSLPVDAPSYITRQADAEFLQALLDGKFCYVLNARQMGKSSLRVQVTNTPRLNFTPSKLLLKTDHLFLSLDRIIMGS